MTDKGGKMTSSTFGDKLNIVQFLDLISLSILIPSVPPTIMKSGGGIIHLGIMMSAGAAARMLSIGIYNELGKVFDKKLLLKSSLLLSTLLNALLLAAGGWFGLLSNRVAFILVNQAPMLCAQLIGKEAKGDSPFKDPQTQRLIASLIGLATVGSMIDGKGGFQILVLLATIISGTALTIVHRLDNEEKQNKREVETLATAFPKVRTAVTESLKQSIAAILQIDIHYANWEPLLVKSLLIINAKVVFILYVVMIILIFHGRGATVCATGAYQTIVILLAGIVYKKLNGRVSQLGNNKQVLETSLTVCAASALILSFSPSHSFFLVLTVPFVFSRHFVEEYVAKFFEISQNQNLRKDVETISAVTEVIGPIFIGLLFHVLSHNGYRVLAVVPFILIYIVVRNRKVGKLVRKHVADKAVEKNKDK